MNSILKYFLFILIYSIIICRPADPNFRIKPLRNQEYTGFISREFFQVVVEVPVTKQELTILEERDYCKKEATLKRDKTVLKLLKSIVIQETVNKNKRIRENEEEEIRGEKLTKADKGKIILNKENANTVGKVDSSLINPKNLDLNKGEFSWFLDELFIHKEDYSDPDKCIYIYRNIKKGLFEKVAKTELANVGEEPLPEKAGGIPSASTGTTTSTTTQPQQLNPLGPTVPIR
jgi:hypothetical protein